MVSLIFLAACSTTAKRGSDDRGQDQTRTDERGTPTQDTEMMGPPEPLGPPTPPAPEQFGPEVPRQRSVVVVLGPGMARGFAHAGALRALHEAKIPISAILGTEIGSLMAGLYASNPNINQFDWMLMRFKRNVLTTRENVFTKVFEKSGRLPIDRELERAFGNKQLQDTTIPVRVAIEFKNSGLAVVPNRGRLSEAVRAALAVPGVLDAASWEGALAVSAENSKPFLIEEARDLNLGPVLLIDVGTNSRTGNGHKSADLVVTPDLSGISENDFEKATEISYRGKGAVNAKITEIRNLLKEFQE
ncbi:MAG TPA: hypothetical protein DCS07_05635 [Bdellovibrionales bacterium]|nr:MAG: hypothetical protein A2Z97_05860 [Bdellovibrionales bacterium GWB1_52_6]OFZ04400.1 MAG: hypothetical protein A2X97_07075 [Bdellovibrionales bacterium GWA1_52_35]HAR42100.1 hypothetical protein [Bdellovibrionales bacterium]HCM40744.1 hypothetical protein [Bdellovibrionales bacterium]